MKAVIQRVINASVYVDGTVISSIGRGLCVLVGISKSDTAKDMEYIVRKILNIRLFEDDGKRWMKSVSDMQYEILCCSQFTLHAVLKGNKPDFHQSMASEQSQVFYQQLLAALRSKYQPDLVKEGQFAAYCHISIVNDGPVTITLDSESQGGDDGGRMPSKSSAQKVSKTATKCRLQPEIDSTVSEHVEESTTVNGP